MPVNPDLPHPELLLERLRALHLLMRDHLHRHIQETAIEQMSQASGLRGGDTIYALDVHSEEILMPFCEAWGREMPFVLVAEGLEEEGRCCGCRHREEARFILITDPVDGTRPLMYDKRSAWMLSGIAPSQPNASLRDIQIAMQTELPTTKALYADQAWAVRGQGAACRRSNLLTGQTTPLVLQPSGAATIEGGYAMFSKFFIGSKGWLAELEERLVRAILGPPGDGQPQTFDDQYICNGGQFYEIMSGRDRFNADLRPLAHAAVYGQSASRLCSHPYDVCTALILAEAGALITGPDGAELDVPLDVLTPVSWIAYANEAIRRQVEPVLLPLLQAARKAPD